MNLRVRRATATFINIDLSRLLIIRVLHLQLVELLRDLLILATQMVKLFLVLADGLQELGVGGLTGEEFLHDLLNVREACLSANLLEGSLNLISPRHLLIHLRLQEGAPEFLRQEVFIHLQLVAILVVAGGLVPNLLLTVVALVSSLKGSFLVIERL